MNDSLVHAGALEQVSLLSTAKSPLKPFLLPRWLSKEVYSAATDSSLVAASPSTRTTLRAPMLKVTPTAEQATGCSAAQYTQLCLFRATSTTSNAAYRLSAISATSCRQPRVSWQCTGLHVASAASPASTRRFGLLFEWGTFSAALHPPLLFLGLQTADWAAGRRGGSAGLAICAAAGPCVWPPASAPR